MSQTEHDTSSTGAPSRATKIIVVVVAILMLLALMAAWTFYGERDDAMLGSTKSGVIGPVEF